MKPLVPCLIGLLAGAVFLVGGCDQAGPTAATASSNASFGGRSVHAALVIRNTGCGVFDGTGELVFATRDFAVFTQSTHQNTTATCKVKKAANPTGHTVRYDSEHNPLFPGLQCSTIGGPTSRWSETISAAGNATLRCHFKGSPLPPDTLTST